MTVQFCIKIIIFLETIGLQTPNLMPFPAPVFDCQTNFWNDTVNCFKTVEIIDSSEEYLPLPLDKIPNAEKIVTIDIFVPAREPWEFKGKHDLDSHRNAWLIEDAKMFHRFPNLKTLILVEFYARIHTKFWLDENLMKDELLHEFFNLPKLTYIKMSNAMELEFEFPISLERLLCVWCYRTNFNLSSNPNLKYVSFSHTRLKTMPEFSQPPPPLKEIVLEGVDLDRMQFNTVDIAYFCKLENLFVQLFVGANIDDERKYCECLRLQKYGQDFNVLIPGMDTKCDVHISEDNFIETDCANYSYEEVRMKREEACHVPSIESPPISNVLLFIIIFFQFFYFY